MKTIHIVGGGLAGSEAAWQCLKSGFHVVLHEMRPKKLTPAHETGNLAEIVCSNSFKSELTNSASGLLKREMSAFGSIILDGARATRVPAGQALAFNRTLFSEFITAALTPLPRFERKDEEVIEIPSAEEMAANDEAWIISSGPLTSDGLAKSIQKLCGTYNRLHFYDAISPIISADSIDLDKGFHASRYDHGDQDYLNLPMSRDEYEAFIDACIAAEKMPLHNFESTQYFEGCLPIEVMIERGRDTLRFGPMKPVGLIDPRTGHRPWANVQLRLENTQATMYSIVGFQTKMKWPDQKRVFGLIPGLANAEYLRMGSIHRNTYVNSPAVLAADLSFKSHPRLFLAGQLTGVEGYVESAAIGMLAAHAAMARVSDKAFTMPPEGTILGALSQYVTKGCNGPFQPMNANLGLLPGLPKVRGQSKEQRREKQCDISREAFDRYFRDLDLQTSVAGEQVKRPTHEASAQTQSV